MVSVSKKELTENYAALTSIPFVRRTIKCVKQLTKENKELRKENEMFKKMIDTLFDMQSANGTKHNGCCGPTVNQPVSEVAIKKERVVVDLSKDISHSTDENVVYDITDKSNNHLHMEILARPYGVAM